MAEAKERNSIPAVPSDMQSILKRCENLEKEVRSLKLNLSFMNRYIRLNVNWFWCWLLVLFQKDSYFANDLGTTFQEGLWANKADWRASETERWFGQGKGAASWRNWEDHFWNSRNVKMGFCFGTNTHPWPPSTQGSLNLWFATNLQAVMANSKTEVDFGETSRGL